MNQDLIFGIFIGSFGLAFIVVILFTLAYWLGVHTEREAIRVRKGRMETKS